MSISKHTPLTPLANHQMWSEWEYVNLEPLLHVVVGVEFLWSGWSDWCGGEHHTEEHFHMTEPYHDKLQALDKSVTCCKLTVQ